MHTIVYTVVRPVSIIPFFHETDAGRALHEALVSKQATAPGFQFYRQVALSADQRTVVFNAVWASRAAFNQFEQANKGQVLALAAARDAYNLNHGITRAVLRLG